VRDARGLPDCVIYDAELAVHTPIELWLSTGVRALDHAVEIFLSDGQHPYADVLSLEAFRRLMRGLPLAKAEPDSIDLRADNQLAAWLSNSQPAVAAAGLSHVLGKQIGARHSIPHGVTSCLLLPHALRFRARAQPERTSELARATGCGNDAADVADAVDELVRSLGLPQHIREYGIGERELRAAAQSLAAQGVEGGYGADQLLEIYCAAL
jgi:alcohol dehydrogenase class IV